MYSQINYHVSQIYAVPKVPVKFISDRTDVYTDNLKRKHEKLIRIFATSESNVQIEFVIKGRGVAIDMIILSTPDQNPNNDFLLLMNHFYEQIYSKPRDIENWSKIKIDSLTNYGRGYANTNYDKLNIQMSRLNDGFTWSISYPPSIW